MAQCVTRADHPYIQGGRATVFRRLAHDEGKCVILVTHSRAVADASDEVIRLKRGRLTRA
ncbi:hypothetical protein [Streptomyces sp. WAC 04229]|uniref:hypothetical protein n=1 Tax=Streptomyces sp. WAC 04229 TaxID=2203206 RepID=UPI003D74901D